MSDIVYCKDCAYAEPNNLDAYHAVKLGVFCTRYRQNTVGVHGCDNGKPKPQTNADRIRNMTDEELAVFLEEVADGCDSCPMLKECTYSDEEISEKQIRLKWLKQEAI